MKKVKTETGWKNQLIKHIRTAKSDDELAIYLELAKKDIAMLANQLSFDFDSQLVNGLFSLSSYYHGASLDLQR